jgi:uncharacterized membrane protein
MNIFLNKRVKKFFWWMLGFAATYILAAICGSIISKEKLGNFLVNNLPSGIYHLNIPDFLFLIFFVFVFILLTCIIHKRASRGKIFMIRTVLSHPEEKGRPRRLSDMGPSVLTLKPDGAICCLAADR